MGLDRLTYFIQEIILSFRSNRLTHIISVACIGLSFSILGLMFVFWWSGDQLTDLIEQESEITAFYEQSLSDNEVNGIIQEISNIQHVQEVNPYSGEDALENMSDILGQDDEILTYFESNPFSPYIEVSVPPGKIHNVVNQIDSISNIEHIRTNIDLLNQLQEITGTVLVVAAFFALLTGLTTCIITAHIVRLGILTRSEEITTLKLLGASNMFISTPFLLEGMILGLIGGSLAAVGINVVLPILSNVIVTNLPFIPVPSLEKISSILIMGPPLIGGMLGLLGSTLPLVKKIREI